MTENNQIEFTEETYYTLHHAIGDEDTKKLIDLLSKKGIGKQINEFEKKLDDKSLLNLASSKGLHKVVAKLIKNGSDINKTILGSTPLDVAIMYDKVYSETKTTKILLENGANFMKMGWGSGKMEFALPDYFCKKDPYLNKMYKAFTPKKTNLFKEIGRFGIIDGLKRYAAQKKMNNLLKIRKEGLEKKGLIKTEKGQGYNHYKKFILNAAEELGITEENGIPKKELKHIQFISANDYKQVLKEQEKYDALPTQNPLEEIAVPTIQKTKQL